MVQKHPRKSQLLHKVGGLEISQPSSLRFESAGTIRRDLNLPLLDYLTLNMTARRCYETSVTFNVAYTTTTTTPPPTPPPQKLDLQKYCCDNPKSRSLLASWESVISSGIILLHGVSYKNLSSLMCLWRKMSVSVEKFPAFYGIRIFSTVFIGVSYLFLSWVVWILPTPFQLIVVVSNYSSKFSLPNCLVS